MFCQTGCCIYRAICLKKKPTPGCCYHSKENYNQNTNLLICSRPGHLFSELKFLRGKRENCQRPRSSLPHAAICCPLTCGVGDGHEGCRVKAALESVQLPFCGGPSETQRTEVLTESKLKDRPPVAFSVGLGVSSPGTCSPASTCLC